MGFSKPTNYNYSYFFNQVIIMNPSALEDILSFCAAALPALEGRVSASADETGTAAETVEMAAICNGLRRAFPDAGAVYWGCRAWQLWIWQPVFLAVWSASLKNTLPDLTYFSHRMGGTFTEPFTIAAHTPAVFDTTESAVFQTALSLQRWQAAQLPLIAPHFAVSGKLAGYFLGDMTLKALAGIHHCGLADADTVRRLETLWHQAFGFRCNGRLRWLETEQGFQVEMMACCQLYRVDGTPYCQGCPKLRKAV